MNERENIDPFTPPPAPKCEDCDPDPCNCLKNTLPPAPAGAHNGCRHHPDQDCPKAGAGEKRWSVYICATCGKIRNFHGDDRCEGKDPCEKWLGTEVVPAADLNAMEFLYKREQELHDATFRDNTALRDKMKEAETLASVRLEEHDRQMEAVNEAVLTMEGACQAAEARESGLRELLAQAGKWVPETDRAAIRAALAPGPKEGK